MYNTICIEFWERECHAISRSIMQENTGGSVRRPRRHPVSIPLLSCPSPVSVSASDRSVCGSKQCTLRSKDVCPGSSDNTLLFPCCPLFPPATPFPHTVLDLTDGQHVTRHFNLQRPPLPTLPPPARLDIFDVLISFRPSPKARTRARWCLWDDQTTLP